MLWREVALLKVLGVDLWRWRIDVLKRSSWTLMGLRQPSESHLSRLLAVISG